MELVCIVCPNGCRLQAEKTQSGVKVTGAKCKRGVSFAEAELTAPTRSVTSSVKTSVKGYPVVSVKTDGEIPKDKIFALMRVLSSYVLTKAVPVGTVIIKDAVGSGVNVVTTAEMEEEYE